MCMRAAWPSATFRGSEGSGALETVRPYSEQELAGAIRAAAADGHALALHGAKSKDGLGVPVEAGLALDLAGLTGIVAYEPDELVITARAGTSLVALEAMLRARGQMFAFEPPDWGTLLGAGHGRATLGGTIAAGLWGPRRVRAGAARDHLLGFAAVNGLGTPFRAGGRVVKNVTGFDLPKLVTGSFGTLAAFTEITMRTAPLPETAMTLALMGLADGEAIGSLHQALSSGADPSGLAHLPLEAAQMSRVDAIGLARAAATLIRVEGRGAAVQGRLQHLRGVFKRMPQRLLGAEESVALWRELRDVHLFARGGDDVVWRLTVPPASAAAAAAAIGGRLTWFDQGGQVVWVAVPPGATGDAGVVLRAAAEACGEAMLVRAPAPLRRRLGVFPCQDAGRAALEQRVRQAFDPAGILNPGRMRTLGHGH